jgi:hypothetical protein
MRGEIFLQYQPAHVSFRARVSERHSPKNAREALREPVSE